MKNLSEFSMKELRGFIIALSAEIKVITNDEEIKNILKAFADAKKGNMSGMTNFDAICAIAESLLITNEKTFWSILAILTQKTSAEVENMNNVECLKVVTDFFTIDSYKKLLSRAITSATRE